VLWSDVAVQRRTVHEGPMEIDPHIECVHPQVRLKCEAVADRLKEAGDKLFTFTRFSETAAMLFWALLASGQITMRKVDGGRPARSGS
jgi:hypothetical protein